MRGATIRYLQYPRHQAISIHAPLAGSDHVQSGGRAGIQYFNPRSPCGERLQKTTGEAVTLKFQSTLPLRGATSLAESRRQSSNFNPRSPCGERRGRFLGSTKHSLFQSTLPLRGATFPLQAHGRSLFISIHAPLAGSDVPYPAYAETSVISIHAPLAGSDKYKISVLRSFFDFNPRSPCGERPDWTHGISSQSTFQSTLPLRGATVAFLTQDTAIRFQSTLPLRGATA